MNDEFDVRYVTVSANKLKSVERIVELARGRPNFVDGEKDWEIIWELFTLWYNEYPEQYDAFQKSIAELRRELKNNNGIIKENGTDIWQRQLEVPMTFHSMIRAVYPDQKWDRKFTKEIAKRIPIIKVPDKI
jgi:hypothetical protein